MYILHKKKLLHKHEKMKENEWINTLIKKNLYIINTMMNDGYIIWHYKKEEKKYKNPKMP